MPAATANDPAVPDIDRLKREAQSVWEAFDGARSAYNAAARRLAVAIIHQLLREFPSISELSVSSEYCFDDEGGYFQSINACMLEIPEGVSDDDLEDAWSEELWEATVQDHGVDLVALADLFGVDSDDKQTLTRAELLALSA